MMNGSSSSDDDTAVEHHVVVVEDADPSTLHLSTSKVDHDPSTNAPATFGDAAECHGQRQVQYIPCELAW